MLWNAYKYGTVLVLVSLAPHSILLDHRATFKPGISDLIPLWTTTEVLCVMLQICIFCWNGMRRGLSCITVTPRKVIPGAVFGAPGVVSSPLRRLTAMTLLYSIYRSLFLTIFSQIIGINIRNYGWFRAVKRIYLRNCVSLGVPCHPQYPPRPSEHN